MIQPGVLITFLDNLYGCGIQGGAFGKPAMKGRGISGWKMLYVHDLPHIVDLVQV